MILTPDVLRAATGCTPARALLFAEHLSAACAQFSIDTPTRLAAFLAQLGHESGSLRWVRELADGRAYEGRRDLGNTEPGDGPRYRGRGLIQLTGRRNYRATAQRLQAFDAPDFEDFPDAVAEPKWAAWTAAEWWHHHGCNELADRGSIVGIGRLINRGNAASSKPANGEADRLRRWEIARMALVQAAPALQAADGQAPEVEAAPVLIDAAAAPTPRTPPTYSLPAGEAGDWQPPEPAAMPIPAVVTALLPSLVQMAPDLIRVFGKSPTAERNAKAAEVVAAIARDVTGSETTEGAVTALQQDEAAQARYREAVHQQMAQLLGVMLQANTADAGERDKAMDRNLTLAGATGGRWLWLLGGICAVLIGFALAVTWKILFSTDFTEGVKMLVLGQIVIGGFALVTVFLFGTNIRNQVAHDKDPTTRQS